MRIDMALWSVGIEGYIDSISIETMTASCVSGGVAGWGCIHGSRHLVINVLLESTLYCR